MPPTGKKISRLLLLQVLDNEFHTFQNQELYQKLFLERPKQLFCKVCIASCVRRARSYDRASTFSVFEHAAYLVYTIAMQLLSRQPCKSPSPPKRVVQAVCLGLLVGMLLC